MSDEREITRVIELPNNEKDITKVIEVITKEKLSHERLIQLWEEELVYWQAALERCKK